MIKSLENVILNCLIINQCHYDCYVILCFCSDKNTYTQLHFITIGVEDSQIAKLEFLPTYSKLHSCHWKPCVLVWFSVQDVRLAKDYKLTCTFGSWIIFEWGSWYLQIGTISCKIFLNIHLSFVSPWYKSVFRFEKLQ